MKRAKLAPLLLVTAVGIGVASGCRTPGMDERSGSASKAERVAATPAATDTAQVPRERPEPGWLPSAPLPVGSVASLESFRVEVTDLVRGDAAWRLLRSANPANEPPPAGSEYLAVRLRLTGVAPKSWVGCSRARVIGTARIAYFRASHFAPAPALARGAVKQGERSEGWCVYSVRANEQNLILMIIAPPGTTNERRYLALEPGAALDPVAIVAPTAADVAGESELAAAPPGRAVHTRDWSVTAVEILRGAAAQRLVEAANPNNKPPAEGLEFVAVKLHALYRGRTEHPGQLSLYQFRAVDGDGKPYDLPTVIDVEPRLSRLLLPGGEHTGWAVFQVAPGDSRALLRFQPFHPDTGRRYLALVGNQ